MKAIGYKKYGSTKVIEYMDIDKPSPSEDEVLVKIYAASINQADAYMLQGKPFPLRFTTGLFKPTNQILGSDIAGVVEEVGANVSELKIRDEVFGEITFKQSGGYAEYALVKPRQVAIKPKEVSFATAAATPMATLTAIQALRLAEVKEGTNLLIYGASGGVGTYLIQVAKHLGATVTAVCSTRNIEVAKTSGADHIIDYKKEQWDKDKIQYDAIIGANGYNKLSRYRDALTKDGIYVISGGSMKQIFATMFLPFLPKKENRKFLSFVAKVAKDDLNLISELLKNGSIKPHIDKEFPLEKTKDAFDHFMTRKTIGKTIIKITE